MNFMTTLIKNLKDNSYHPQISTAPHLYTLTAILISHRVYDQKRGRVH